jgi:hypothetical protein
MATIILILAVTGTLTLAGLALLAIVTVGIHASERRMNLNRIPKTATEKFASRIVGSPGETTK